MKYMMQRDIRHKASFTDICCYSSGEGVNSLIMNTIFGFAMIYFTEALGMDYRWAGLALGIATFWDAITDPLMGHITDNTRSRFGRRHPYLLIGGIGVAVSFYFFWAVPHSFRDPISLFCYLVLVNIILRTGITVFMVSHMALGFEICTDYNQRTTLQSVRNIFNMIVNLAGPAMAWTLFFKDSGDVESTSVPSNYVKMGAIFAVAAVVFTIIVTFSTRKYAVDSRDNPEIQGNGFRDFIKDFKEIISDPYPRTVFIFMIIVLVGIVLMCSLQIYLYVYFMKFSSGQKSIVHGSSMVGSALGALAASLLVRRFDKRPAIITGVVVSIICNVCLLLMFVLDLVPRDCVYNISWAGGLTIPISMLLFMIFHASYHGGNGILFPVANSMMADISEVNKHRTGILKDGAYAAMLSFVTKVAITIGMVFSGFCLDWAGFVSGSETQSPEAIRNIAIIAFTSGIIIPVIALLSIVRYPVTRNFMQKLREESKMDTESNPC
jgi:GPH family glycoside/pentoside/hexuronide:cation symporter